MKRATRYWILACLCFCGGCQKNPSDGLVNSGSSNSVPPTGSTMIIYDDTLKTGGGVGLFPSGDNQQINLASTTLPHSGEFCINYSWNGNDVSNPGGSPNPEHTFAGFDLFVSNSFTTLASTPGRDLSAAGYTQVTFWLRGSLSASTTIKVEVAGTGSTSTIAPSIIIGTLQNYWQQFSVPVSPSDLKNVKEFFKLTFVYAQPTGTTAPGGGGSVFVDDIQYQK